MCIGRAETFDVLKICTEVAVAFSFQMKYLMNSW